MRQTTLAKKETVKKKWYLIDAKDEVLGRLAVKVATILRGKDQPIFTPNVDMGDNVIIINAQSVVLTGNKEEGKLYHNFSGHPGGIRTRKASTLRERKPLEMIEIAVKGMLPKGVLGRQQFRNMYVYADANHKHEAQKPIQIKVED